MKLRIKVTSFFTPFSDNKYYDLIRWVIYYIFKPITIYPKGFGRTTLFRILFWDIERPFTDEEIVWLKKRGFPKHWMCRSIIVPKKEIKAGNKRLRKD